MQFFIANGDFNHFFFYRKGWELLAILLAIAAPGGTDINEKLRLFLERNSDKLLDSPEVGVSNSCRKRNVSLV